MLTKNEENIYRSIRVPSEDNPERPEFPPQHPKFPATPTTQIHVPGFSRVFVKDESVNPTGTHKDRMAWEIVTTYKQFLRAKKEHAWITKLPELSILSSGSAALAIQTMLRQYRLPSLRVLLDQHIDERVIHALKRIGCKVFVSNLSKSLLEWQDILRLTKNVHGFDITSNAAFNPSLRFYDWLSYEVLLEEAEYVFLPFGTGQLYENILNIVKHEATTKRHDPRFHGSVRRMTQCHYMGATTSNPRTKADKLYAPFLPFANYSEQWLRYYKHAGVCGQESGVYAFNERVLDRAIMIAADSGIVAEPSGVAGLALLLQMRRQVPTHAKVLIINTGRATFTSPQ